MGTDEITFEDLLAAEPAGAARAGSFAQLKEDGFPAHGGMEALCEIAQLAEPGPKFAALRGGYQQILEGQRRAQVNGTGDAHHAGVAAVDGVCALIR